MTDVPHRSGYTMEDMEPFLKGATPLPNASEVENLAAGLASIMRMEYLPGMWFVKLSSGHSAYRAHLFIERGQGGQFYGSGAVITAATVRASGRYEGQIWRFAICVHEAVDTATREQSMRGYHPAHCSLCGLDMTVDSGD